MTTAKNRLISLKNQIHKAELVANRTQNSVQLMAVSKTWQASVLKEIAELGQMVFGENYLQEALIKIEALKAYDIEWHFIGPIQSNKTKDIAQHFHWVHSVDREKIARRLSAQRPQSLPPLNVCIQVNIDNESTKSGVDENALFLLAEKIVQLENVTLRGLMIIPTKTDDEQQQRASFKKAYQLFQTLSQQFSTVDTLSMGMSSDMTLAIEEGSTMVRVGTALFGQRSTPSTVNTVK
jgi:pyridoxal phosphate enzyme (YggS family)